MKATKIISILVLAAVAAWGQGAAAKPAVKSATSTAKPATATAKAATKPASQMAPVKAGKTTTAAPMTAKAKMAPVAKTAKPITSAAKKPATKAPAAAKVTKAKTAATPAAAKSIAPVKPLGKRDPFVSVIVARSDSSAACTGGKRCLIVDQIALRGIVRTPTKWIAMVENPARKTYYLYENDPIFNAVVVRITGDSVIFRESIMDALGHSTEREVVKRVNAPAI
jgi:hypothetical protein